MAEIEKLDIVLSANADNAVRNINRLISSMQSIQGSASNAAGGVTVLGDSMESAAKKTQDLKDETRTTSPKVRKLGQDAEEAGKRAKKGSSGLSSFLSTLKRIAYYRIVRTVIKEITESIKEGISNLYHWSSTINGRFAKSLDRLATSSLYLKNSLAAMLAPIIETLTPVIEWVVDKIVDVINLINKLFAALSGSKTYYVAKKVAQKWDDTTEKAKETADEIKRTILGFDEINKLTDNTGSSSTGTGSDTDYSTMFEERQLTGWMAALADFISKTKTAIPALLLPIITAFESIKALLKTIKERTREWLDDLATAADTSIQIAVSLVRSGWETIREWAESFGTAVVGIGVTLLTTAKELWSAFKREWKSLGEKVFSIGIVISTTALSLWLALKKSWQNLGQKTLLVTAAIATTATFLWSQLKKAWGAVEHKVFSIGVELLTTAAELWDSLRKAWNDIKHRALGFTVVMATTAATLWAALKSEWKAIQHKVLNFAVAITTTALSIWESLKKGWEAIENKVFDISVAISTTAFSLWVSLKNAWEDVKNKVLNFSVSISETAQELWNGLSLAWNNVQSKVLYFSVAISQSAQTLWDGIKTGWNSITNKVASFGVSISTSISSLWDWVKRNWKIIAVGALGIGVAIATPWSALATAISGLWAKATAAIGGGLVLSLFPALAEVEYKGDLVQFGKDAVDKLQEGWGLNNKFVIDFSMRIFGLEWDGSTDLWDWLWNHKSETRQLASGSGSNPEIKVLINGEPANGFDSNFDLDPTIQANLDNNPLNVSVDAQTAWGNRGQSPISYFGLDNLSTTIGVGLRMQQSTITLTGSGGGTWRLMAQELGGIIHSNGLVQRISAYANGTANAHGTMFLAGEAGPEIVGHVGGRTEVLNKSQLAQTMFSAVRSAMSGATIQTQVYDGSGFESNDENSELMMEMIRLGSEATMQQNDLLRQQNEYLRELNDKRFTAEVSTADIIRAQSRINRRAGTTIVPIGT